jgi:hypothetical protein
MYFFNRFKRVVAISLIALTAITTGCATVKTHPEFNERHANIRSMAVLPPDTQAFEITFNAGNKPLKELEELVKGRTAEAISKALKDKGYEVVDVKIQQKDIDSNSALKEAFFEIQTLYKKATEEIAKNKKKQFTYDVGSSPNYFSEKYNVNTIVITRQVASKLSSGNVAAQVVSTTASIITAALVGVSVGGGMTPPYTLATEIAIVDADLGDVLWYHLAQTNENYTNEKDPKPITKLVETILKPLPPSKFKSSVPVEAKGDAGSKKPTPDSKHAPSPANSVMAKSNFGTK